MYQAGRAKFMSLDDFFLTCLVTVISEERLMQQAGLAHRCETSWIIPVPPQGAVE